jgi:ABC-2 type transport system permease protein
MTLPRKFASDFYFLFLEQLLEIRVTWYWHLIFAGVLPVTMVFGFPRMGTSIASMDSLIYIISGATIFAAANDGLYTLAVRLGQMKKDGVLLYYMSLPISPIAFICAQMLSRLLITLPGMVITILAGVLLYDVPLSFSPWIFVLLLLCGLAFSAVGMTLGLYIENLELLQVITNLLLFMVILVTPVFTTIEALPMFLRPVAYVMPTTYAAAALRAALTGSFDQAFYLHVSILTLLTLIGFVLLKRGLRWQLHVPH